MTCIQTPIVELYEIRFSYDPKENDGRYVYEVELPYELGYVYNKRKEYQLKGYKILPDAYIKEELIAPQWDEVLRFIATIKLKEETASQLFKRLNSYSRQHPLCIALKEFGKIPKTDFLLQTAVTRELTLYGSCASQGEYPACLDMIARGAINVDALISAVAPLSDGAVWFERLYNKEPGLMKVILKP